MATPGGGSNCDCVQSSMRTPIECAFGISIRTWGVLWRPLEVDFKKRAPLVSALISRHNVRRDWKLGEPECPTRTARGFIQLDSGARVEKEHEEWEVAPGRWLAPASFDELGRPIGRRHSEATSAAPAAAVCSAGTPTHQTLLQRL